MKWPAHLAERAAIFELTGQDDAPLERPTRVPLVIEEDQYIEFDPRNLRVVGVGRVCVSDKSQQMENQS